MDTIALQVQPRQANATAKALRRQDIVPGIVYGNMDNTPLQCKLQEVYRVYQKAGESTVVELDLNGKKFLCDSFCGPRSSPDKISHIDFLAIDMTKEVTTHVPIHLELNRQL